MTRKLEIRPESRVSVTGAARVGDVGVAGIHHRDRGRELVGKAGAESDQRRQRGVVRGGSTAIHRGTNRNQRGQDQDETVTPDAGVSDDRSAVQLIAHPGANAKAVAGNQGEEGAIEDASR